MNAEELHELRQGLEGVVALLIEVLDWLDPDPDFEPSIGGDDREADPCDQGEPDEEGEPELGATHCIDQSIAWEGAKGWIQNGEPSLGWTGAEAAYGFYTSADWQLDELELEHDGREPEDWI